MLRYRTLFDPYFFMSFCPAISTNFCRRESSFKIDSTLVFQTMTVLGVVAIACFGANLLGHWTLRSSLFLGGSIVVGGILIKVALFILIRPKDDVWVEKLQKTKETPSFARDIFKVSERSNTYYVKIKSNQKKAVFFEHVAGSAPHPLNDLFAYEIIKFIQFECVPETWFFKDIQEFENSSLFSHSFKMALMKKEEFRANVFPFIIQTGIQSAVPYFGEKFSNEWKEKSNHFYQTAKVETRSVHEAFLSICLIGNTDVRIDNCPVEIALHGCVGLFSSYSTERTK